MNRRAFGKLLAGGAALLPALRGGAQTSKTADSQPLEVDSPTSPFSPFDVGTRAQLFVDQMLVRESKGVAFTLHRAEKHDRNPLLVADRPWEGRNVEIYGDVLYDEEEKSFKMWYLGDPPPGYFVDVGKYANPCLFATSVDGITWEKPLVGTIQALKAGMHNAVALADLGSVIKDRDDPDPAKRYKMLCYSWVHAPLGYSTMISPDGLNWKPFNLRPIAPSPHGEEVNSGYYDETRRLYVNFIRIDTEIRGFNRFTFNLITSKDFEHWTEPQRVFEADLRDDLGSLARIEQVRPMLRGPDNPSVMRTNLSGLGFYPTESCTVAFPCIATISNYAPPTHALAGCTHATDGPMEIQLAASRDLVSWDRSFRTPCLPLGAIGEWDSGMLCTQSRALRVADEVWLYYGGYNGTHACRCFYESEGTGKDTKCKGSIGLAKWKLDRFVSADGPSDGGTLTTVPMVFSGDRLEVNARVREGGNLAVEILDAASRPIEGFGLSDPINGDHLRQPITWHGHKSVSNLRGKPVSLRFYLQRAELYSFAFRQ